MAYKARAPSPEWWACMFRGPSMKECPCPGARKDFLMRPFEKD